MVYRALRSFSGVISMAAGEERELKDQYLIENLLKVGYILPVRDASEDQAPLKENEKAKKKRGAKK